MIIPIIATPILSRLYAPRDFGLLALFTSVVSILNYCNSGRYELAVLVPASDEEALEITIYTCILSTAFSILVLIAVLCFGAQISHFLGNMLIQRWLFLVPVLTITMGCYTAIRYFMLRRKYYVALSRLGVTQAVTDRAVGISFGFGHLLLSGAQILAYAVGQVTVTAALVNALLKDKETPRHKPSWGRMKELAIKYKNFPLYSMPADTINGVGRQLPVLMMTTFFGPAIVGYYNIATRVYGMSTGLISATVGDVWRQQASAAFSQTGSCRSLWIKTFKRLAILALVPGIPVALFGPAIFAFCLGKEWRTAGHYAQILSPFIMLGTFASPLSIVLNIAGKQRYDLIWQVFLFLINGAALYIGAIRKSPEMALALYTTGYSLMYLVYLRMSYVYSEGTPPSLGDTP